MVVVKTNRTQQAFSQSSARSPQYFSLYLSLSPNTMSMLPMIATTSAIICP